MVGADDGIAADADGRRLADATLSQLEDRFVGQRAGAGNDADVSFYVYATRHDADLAFSGRDDSRAIGPNQARAGMLQLLPHAHHVERRNPFRDADDQRNARVLGLQNRVRGKWRRHKNHRGVSAGFVDGLLHCVEHGPAFMGGSTFAGGHAADNFGAIFGAALGMECAFAAGNSLYDQASFFID